MLFPPLSAAEKRGFIEEHGRFQPYSRRKMKRAQLQSSP